MMVPCFKCKNCETNWIVDIYTNSKDGILQNFISSTCCPICGKRNLRICFLQKIEDQVPSILDDALDFNEDFSQSM
jgi:hypothetical protein